METRHAHGAKLGVSFSGGGIRSAAFCSGVLRKLLQRNVEPDYLSCVSGGGYTGTAYLDWKYRKGKDSNNENRGEAIGTTWNEEFFAHMRSHSGYICNWQKCCVGSFDTFVFLIFIAFVNLCIPVFLWGSLAFPVAFLINRFFGPLLNSKRYQCDDESIGENCPFPVHSVAYDRMLLFVIPSVIFVLLHLVTYFIAKFQKQEDQPECSITCQNGMDDQQECCTTKCCKTVIQVIKKIVNFLKAASGLTFAFTFLPWFINDYLEHTPRWVQAGIVFLSGVFWFFVPVLRHYSSLVILIYCCSYVVYWHVFDDTFLTIQHTDQLFHILLSVSMIILGIASVIGDFYLRFTHLYNRWRLQKAFYTKESAGKCGCNGISCYDCFPGTHTCCTPPKSTGTNIDNGLSLHHLKEMKPQYISNVVVNGWRTKIGKPKYRLLTMSPEGIEVIDSQPQSKINSGQPPQDDSEQENVADHIEQSSRMFKNKLEPDDIKLSSAMAISAAAISPHLGIFGQEEQAFRHILTIIGLDMAAAIVYDINGERDEHWCKKILLWIFNVFFVGQWIIFPIIYFAGYHWDLLWLTVVFPLFVVLVLAVCLYNTENECARWLHVHVPFSRFVRSIFNIVNTGPVPPAMLHLSDGGHFENLGILPLFKLRLKKILVVNGGYIGSDSCYRDDLVHALELAREMLNCSFTTMDRGDVLADIKETFISRGAKDGKFPRTYKFKVRYYNDKDPGEVVLLAPRHPEKGLTNNNEDTWASENLNDLDLELWGEGPVLKSVDVDRLMFCCCECCNNCGGYCTYSHKFRARISRFLCGAFPHHNIANQFFTPRMFRDYHREGYRACMEADTFFQKKRYVHVTV